MADIIHVIPSLDFGGAERQLMNLVTTEANYSHLIISLRGVNDDFLSEYGCASYDIIDLGNDNWVNKIRKMTQITRRNADSLVQAWMYHACFLSTFLVRPTRLIWNIRRSDVSLGGLGLRTFIVVQSLILISKFIDGIRVVYCAERSKEAHVNAGLRAAVSVVVPNGISVPSEVIDRRDNDDITIGFIGRNVKEKNFAVFTKFLIFLEAQGYRCNVLIAGRGYENFDFTFEHIRVGFLGEISDLSRVYNEIDLLFSTSLSEGFPNVVAEAMAHGVIPVCSDAGDSWLICGEYGIRLASFDMDTMFNALLSAKELMSTLDRRVIHLSIKNRFSQAVANERYCRNVWCQ